MPLQAEAMGVAFLDLARHVRTRGVEPGPQAEVLAGLRLDHVRQVLPPGPAVLDVVFDPQSYGIAMPNGSLYREAVDVATLEAIRDERWKETLFRYLGEKR